MPSVTNQTIHMDSQLLWSHLVHPNPSLKYDACMSLLPSLNIYFVKIKREQNMIVDCLAKAG